MDLPGEEWKLIKGTKIYEISNYGHVKNNVTKTFVLPWLSNGYAKIRVKYHLQNGTTLWKDERLHRLVIDHFGESVKGKTQVNHIDGNKLNNKIENLEWVTASENMKHYFEKVKSKPARVKLIWSKKGEEDLVFDSIQSCAEHFGKARATIWGYSLNGKAYGYTIKREIL